jgi:hypothetical protein
MYSAADDSYAVIKIPGPDCTFDPLENLPSPPSTCLPSVEDINPAGAIVGYYDNNDGVYRGFIGKLEQPANLQAGDADQDLDFDQLDLVHVQIAAKYLTGQAATWGDGDWNGAPGGSVGNPPLGDGLFSQLDIVAAQQAGLYLSGEYGATSPLAVPEPSAVCLAASGSAGLLACRRRSRPRSAQLSRHTKSC